MLQYYNKEEGEGGRRRRRRRRKRRRREWNEFFCTKESVLQDITFCNVLQNGGNCILCQYGDLPVLLKNEQLTQAQVCECVYL
jgi:hypothetical protein